MVKIRKNIFLIFSISLVLLIWVDVYANSAEVWKMTKQNTDMQTPISTSGGFSDHNDLCEDEQVHQVVAKGFMVESAVYIKNSQIINLVFQPCKVPWEPPK
jgi:hypothetical protein